MLKVLDNEVATEEQAEGPTLDELAREGARRMLMKALAVEVAQHVDEHADDRDEQGRRLVVRNGQAQARNVTCGAGTLEVRAPRVNDKRVEAGGQRQRFTSRILPPYMRRSPKVAEVLPILYLRGLSPGDFREALPVLLGEDAAGLSATNIARLTAAWAEDYRRFRQRDLADRDYVYVWVDGIHFNIRLEDDRLDWGAARWDERARGARGRLPREHGQLGDRAPGPEAPGDAGAGGRGRRRRLGLLGGRARRVARDAGATRLVPQAWERARQVAEAAPGEGEARVARDHVRRDA